MTNLGRGEVLIKNFDFSIIDTISEENSRIFPKIEIEFDYTRTIPINNNLECELGICFNQAELANLIKKTQDEMVCYFTFETFYTDMFNSQKYELDIIFVFETYLEENKVIFDLQDYNQVVQNINKRGGHNA